MITLLTMSGRYWKAYASAQCTIRPQLSANWAIKTEKPREKHMKTVRVSGRKIISFIKSCNAFPLLSLEKYACKIYSELK